ncbi:MAG: hypothetical protein QMD09_14640, partial [Desulfatibacillaceae bacterium]|nr:hypothetical protein [Desulfatibacillaceae bacterium]
ALLSLAPPTSALPEKKSPPCAALLGKKNPPAVLPEKKKLLPGSATASVVEGKNARLPGGPWTALPEKKNLFLTSPALPPTKAPCGFL